ncbi:CBS domain-containing protein [Methanotorris igneus]|nr:CBS domain-containing protein [Methanotorris igneus]
MEVNMVVSDAMSTPVITVDTNTTVYDVANIMKEKKIGCVVVVEKDSKPLGIVTERDLVINIVAKNLKPKDVLVKDIMTTKLITISPNATLMDAARKMAEKNIKRLPVVEGDKLLGIITVSDITKISPKIFEIMYEMSKIGGELPYRGDEYIEGICEVCGSQGSVRLVNGRYICDNCIDEL